MDRYVPQLRNQILTTWSSGRGAKWRDAPASVEWLDTVAANGYRLKKFRYQAIPGMWMAALYEPAQLNGRVPVVTTERA
jgi:hypothetical protein